MRLPYVISHCRFIAWALSESGKSPGIDVVGLHALHILQSV